MFNDITLLARAEIILDLRHVGGIGNGADRAQNGQYDRNNQHLDSGEAGAAPVCCMCAEITS